MMPGPGPGHARVERAPADPVMPAVPTPATAPRPPPPPDDPVPAGASVGAVDPVEFVRAHTALGAPPYLPELRLHLAADAFTLWERTEEELGGGVVSAPPFWAFPWAGGQALAWLLLHHPDLVRDRSVLDHAAG